MKNLLIIFRFFLLVCIVFFVSGFSQALTAQQLAYVALKGGDQVAVFDLETQAELGRFDVGDAPRGVTLNNSGTEVWVTLEQEDTVRVFDASSYTTIASIPVDSLPYGVALNPSNTKAYVANSGESTVTVIDAINKTVITTLPVGLQAIQPVVSRDGKYVFVPNRGGCSSCRFVTVLDGEADTVITSISMSGEPYGATLSVTGDTLILGFRGGRKIEFIDVNTLTRLSEATISTPGHKNIGITLSADGKNIYAATDQDNVLVINIPTATITHTISVGRNPWGIARSRDGNYVIATNWNTSGTVSIISTATNTVVSTVSTGNQPVGFGDFTGYIHADFPTPVEWLGVDAAWKGEQVLLNWTTATEVNNHGFVVERSVNGRHWDQVGFVIGQGDSDRPTTYQYADQAPQQQTLAYRLKQIDFDGAYDYSPIVEVFADQFEGGLAVYPVPFSDILYVDYPAGTATLTNLQGQLLRTHTLTGGQTAISTQSLPAGWYVLTIQPESGFPLYKEVLKR